MMEHYVRDDLVLKFARRHLALNIDSPDALYYATLTTPILRDPKLLTLTGIWVNATYRTVFHLKERGTVSNKFKSELLRAYASKAVHGHAPSRRIYDNRFLSE